MRGTPHTLRYQIVDEPRRSVLTRFALPPLLLLPVTIYCAMIYSPLFWLLPGANALLVNGTHKWREVGFSVLALVVFFVAIITFGLLEDAAIITGIGVAFSRDAVLALTVLPLVKVLSDQQHTVELRKQLGI